ncbi:PREDICTED: mediator of RNA polymerase II transcription subunit 6 [Tarenaya hassleriana]|uniref:mediator of RNA polymerase II transcription subunit 6 n=1 Tax=Tarenaya hassleriana TaxID=28532 RepID=UPI00053C972A|nr:PREDICTED: mediator of RNA polymerase II transcription subunit 6 [Tarenaya hassleriana]
MAAPAENFNGNVADQQVPPRLQPLVTDMTGICFRDQLWLNTYPLDRNYVFDYFALSPFYDTTCNNELLRRRSVHPLDLSQLSKMTGLEYMLTDATEPNLFIIRKQKRDGPEKVTPMLTYYILDGSIYQAPQLCNVFAARVGRAVYNISKAFSFVASKLEPIRQGDAENQKEASESKPASETVDLKEMKRVDTIMTSLFRKLPPAPPPPAFPEGYVSQEASGEKEDLAESQPQMDPIIDQGPSKRMKF